MPQNVEIEEEESKIELENQRPDNVCAKGDDEDEGKFAIARQKIDLAHSQDLCVRD